MPEKAQSVAFAITSQDLQQLIDRLRASGHQVVGPRKDGAATVLGSVSRIDQLPSGRGTDQRPGYYRHVPADSPAAFGVGVPAHAWKQFLYPPSELLFRVRQGDGAEVVDDGGAETARYAFVGVRACDLQAIRALDTVLGGPRAADPRFAARRAASVVIAVNCTQAVATCFCGSMNTGPRAAGGYDLALTEIAGGDDGDPTFVVTAGSERGGALLREIESRPASAEELAAEGEAVERARTAQTRTMVADVEQLIAGNLEHRRWEEVATRCLGCANCTMVCPTCFCATVEDVTDLAGTTAERWRKWDSCFTRDFSYLHGGSIRRSGAARYRQWMAHKLSAWWQQFGTSGCVGCGRCITWCPVGIDITAEARALSDSVRGSKR